MFEDSAYQNYLKFCGKFYRYSANNILLIMLQRPDASHVASFTAWKKLGRFPRKGVKGIRILAPAPMRKEVPALKPAGEDDSPPSSVPKEEVIVTHYRLATVFDISDTEGKPVPEWGPEELTGSVEGYRELINAVIQTSPVPVEFAAIDGDAKGYFSKTERKIVIKEGMSEQQTLKTLIHEAAHELLHSDETGKDRFTRETEAESVAALTAAHFGIDSSGYSCRYIAGYAKNNDIKTLKSSLETIRSAAAVLIDRTEKELIRTGAMKLPVPLEQTRKPSAKYRERSI